MQHLITRQPHAKGRRPVRALILTPTRELAAQIGENVRDYSKYLNIRSLVVFAGASLGASHQVAAFQHRRDRLLLNRGGFTVTLLGNGAQDIRA
ncbi:hypothetical protein AWF69_00200 [Escherichia coli]|nr:hypothetical protein AWF69_00200 [Escherichia coli]